MSNSTSESSGPKPTSKAGKRFLRLGQSIYRPLGFKKGYNFILFFILVGAMMGFVLARFQYLDIDGRFLKRTIPGDAIHYQSGYKRMGIIIHLACILPAGFLVCFQYVPIIRHKFILFHRLNGYTVILLLLISNAGAYMIIPIAAGGSPSTQVVLGVLATATTVSAVLAYINIKRLRIDQHRAWMIRTWVYAGSIISLRLVQMAANTYISRHQNGHWYDIQTCSSIWAQWTLYGAPPAEGNPTPYLYPQCAAPNSSEPVIVKANVNGIGPENATASFHNTFGMSLWLCLTIHAIAVEVYLNLTPAESERLRLISYEKRLEAGFKVSERAQPTVNENRDAFARKPASSIEPDQRSSEPKGNGH